MIFLNFLEHICFLHIMTEHEIPFNCKCILVKSHHENASFQPLTVINCLNCRDPVAWISDPGDWVSQKLPSTTSSRLDHQSRRLDQPCACHPIDWIGQKLQTSKSVKSSLLDITTYLDKISNNPPLGCNISYSVYSTHKAYASKKVSFNLNPLLV